MSGTSVMFGWRIAAVSSARGTLGAFQNRFEHTINNLNVSVENLAASESRIRDTDMASEMTNFTRTQVLTQAGTAMLAQAKENKVYDALGKDELTKPITCGSHPVRSTMSESPFLVTVARMWTSRAPCPSSS